MPFDRNVEGELNLDLRKNQEEERECWQRREEKEGQAGACAGSLTLWPVGWRREREKERGEKPRKKLV